jgi:hypothetical protein
MLKKYILIGFLGLMVVLAVSAFGSVSYRPAVNNTLSIADNGFRLPHMWNGIYIPSMDVTGLLADPRNVRVPEISASGYRAPHMWNGIFIPSMAETGFISDSMPDKSNQSVAVPGLQMPPKLNSGH